MGYEGEQETTNPFNGSNFTFSLTNSFLSLIPVVI